MATTMKSFRLDEDAIYDLETVAKRLGCSQAKAIEVALDWFLSSGAGHAIADMKYQGDYNGYKSFKNDAISDGELRAKLRANVGLGVAPIIY